MTFARTETASATTVSAFSILGAHSIGINKSAWQSTWSVEEPISESFTRYSGMTNPYADIKYPCPPKRPPIIRRNAEEGTWRRWSLAMAVTDEGLTDEALVEQLERLRGSGDEKVNKDNVYGGPEARLRHARRNFSRQLSIPFPAPPTLRLDGAVWHTARRALLRCREIVRTERNYLAQIRVLLGGCGGTATPPPALMLTYVPALVSASEALLRGMESDPSAWGVAAAFLIGEEALEAAFVGWSGIVGGFFVGRAEDVGLGRVVSEKERKSMISWRGRSGARRNSMSIVEVSAHDKLLPTLRLSRLLSRTGSSVKQSGAERRVGKPTVRDLAILPIQRVMRYVMLYRGMCILKIADIFLV